MTCIVGIETSNGVIIGGDSAGVADYALSIRADQKVFRRDAYVFGFTTSFRMGQLLRYAGHLPHVDTWDVDAFMATRFIDAVRALLKDGGYARNHEGEERGGTFLVGVVGRLYVVDSDYQVGRQTCGYDAVGCGGNIAIGSLYTSAGSPIYKTNPEARAIVALEAAAAFSAGVAGPFHVVAGEAA